MDTQHKDTLVIRGYVEAIPLGPGREKGAKIAIVTEEGAMYSVIPKGAGRELLQHVSAPVEVRGVVTKEEEVLFLQVNTYQVQDGFDDAWYDE